MTLQLSDNALEVLERRYLFGRETPEQLFRRVADAIARAELSSKFDKREMPAVGWYSEDQLANYHVYRHEFYELLTSLKFLPNSPTLGNAGKPNGQLSACFVLPVEDTMESIFGTLKDMAMIHKSGGGTGFSFSRLRPTNDEVASTGGIASGPVSFMKVYDATTEVVKQGGSRRGANMAIMRCDHPDIREFITCKADMVTLQNFNISVAVTNKFMTAVRDGADFDLINPKTGAVTETVNASELFDLIIENAWKNGDPGLYFIDEANRLNPVPKYGQYEATNPCGEQSLFPYDSCNLGSIDVSKFVTTLLPNDDDVFDLYSRFDWEEFRRVIHLAVRFLDNVIEVNHYPVDKIHFVTQDLRRIGLGPMGIADAMFALGVRYDSPEGHDFLEHVMSFLKQEADAASSALAIERGAYPLYDVDAPVNKGIVFRNANRTTVAPTGTLSILADCSGGIEPVFSLAFMRQHRLDRNDPLVVTNMVEVNKHFKRALDDLEVSEEDQQQVFDMLLQGVPLSEIHGFPAWVYDVFRTAHDIEPESHVYAQALAQEFVDNAVSKTINMPRNATEEDIRRVYMLAWELNCKGITVYRDGSRALQVLTHVNAPAVKDEDGVDVE